MDAIGVLLLLLGALGIGMIGQKSRLLPHSSGWLTGTAAAAIGAFTGSELVGTTGRWGAEVGGLVVLPALVTGALFAVVADLLTRFLTPGPLGWHSQELLGPAPGPARPAPRRRHRRNPGALGQAGRGNRSVPAAARRG